MSDHDATTVAPPAEPGVGDVPGGTIADVTPAQIEVDKVIRSAKAEGSITAADLADKLSTLDLTPDDTDAVYQRLMDLGVDVVEDEALAEEADTAEVVEPAPDAEEDRRRA